MSLLKGKKVVLTHHWMFKMRGGEKVLEQFCLMFPDAEIKCLVFGREGLSDTINRHKITGSFLQRSSFARKNYKQLLPLHPIAIGRMSVPDDTDVVICSDASMIKGIKVPKHCKVICYCHSPPRYLWEMADEYAFQTDGMNAIKRLVFRAGLPICKRFDYKSAQRVDHFIANSKFVADRIKRHYGKEADVVYPPVAVEEFDHTRERKDFYLIVSELVAYKRIDIAIDAFKKNGLPLVIIGDGTERKKLESAATPNLRFLGTQPFSVLKEHLETCKAFVFPGVEDFGITPVEAQAAGAPVVAFGAGGVLETVQENYSGVFFRRQAASSLQAALYALSESDKVRASNCRKSAENFIPSEFRSKFVELLTLL